MIKIKILIITGLQAKDLIIKNLAKYEKHDIYLKVLPMPIAAFITPQLIIYHLKENQDNTLIKYKKHNTSKQYRHNLNTRINETRYWMKFTKNLI